MEKSKTLIDEKQVNKKKYQQHIESKSKHEQSQTNINWKLEYINHFYVEQISILTGKGARSWKAERQSNDVFEKS